MKPIDFRNATFAELQERLTGQRAAVLVAWREHGPATTEDCAARSGISILSFRPRTTELFQLGFIVLDERAPGTHAGRYRALTSEEWRTWFVQQQQARATFQPELSLT